MYNTLLELNVYVEPCLVFFVRRNAYFITQTTSLPHLLVPFPSGLVKTLWTCGISILLTH